MAYTYRTCSAEELVFETRDDGALSLIVEGRLDAPVRFIINRGGGTRWNARVPWWIYVWEKDPSAAGNAPNGGSLWVQRIDMTQHRSEEEIKEVMLNCARIGLDTGVLNGYTS